MCVGVTHTHTHCDRVPAECQLSWHTVVLSSTACSAGEINIEQRKIDDERKQMNCQHSPKSSPSSRQESNELTDAEESSEPPSVLIREEISGCNVSATWKRKISDLEMNSIVSLNTWKDGAMHHGQDMRNLV